MHPGQEIRGLPFIPLRIRPCLGWSPQVPNTYFARLEIYSISDCLVRANTQDRPARCFEGCLCMPLSAFAASPCSPTLVRLQMGSLPSEQVTLRIELCCIYHITQCNVIVCCIISNYVETSPLSLSPHLFRSPLSTRSLLVFLRGKPTNHGVGRSLTATAVCCLWRRAEGGRAGVRLPPLWQLRQKIR